jgi:DNA replication protein DnaC
MGKKSNKQDKDITPVLKFLKLDELCRNIEKGFIFTQPDDYESVNSLYSALIPDFDNKRNARISRYGQFAKFPMPHACVENIDFSQDRGLNQDFILRLAAGDYINNHNNVVILGPSGSGKTYLANSLGIAANRNLVKVKYWREPDLFEAAEQAHLEGTYDKFIRTLQNVPVLIIDEWLITKTKDEHLLILLNIFEKRYERKSTILCSHFDYGEWVERLGSTSLAESIVDRLTAHAYKIIIGGNKSMRVKTAGKLD